MIKNLLVRSVILVTIATSFVTWSSARATSEKTTEGAVAKTASPSEQSTSQVAWQSSAKLQRGISKVSGTLIVDAVGVEFRPNKGNPTRWPFVEIQTLYLAPRKLILDSYERRGRFRMGTRKFHFELGDDMPSLISAALARQVSRPVRNANPGEHMTGTVSVPVHHITVGGGSNGALRFSDDGIDYIARTPKDSRSWRWTDLQTLSYPDAYHFTVFGYLETYSFDLKQPLPAGIYDRATDEIFKHSETGLRSTSNKSAEGPSTNPE